ncbi:DUF4424 family protein [Acinetobacter piscicola]|uniref:DUF4424 family protein n=1 Tax=Acinetobacter piscicola TaxID=2006115 RepID=UPI000B7EC062|nr:DUF4424 family protein [Acinetobacter piscicola]
MKIILFVASFCVASSVVANDSTGYVGTGGIEYLKNKNIAMQSEDLFISKKKIKVDYQFKNLSQRDITETVLFPLPKVQNYIEYDYADANGLVESFKVTVNGKVLKPKVHVHAFLPSNEQQYVQDEDFQGDVTTALLGCGLTEQELMSPWKKENSENETKVIQKIAACSDPKVQKLLKIQDDDYIRWQSQVIYSWQQTFKANTITQVSHQYQPLVGGSASLYPDEYNQQFCMDKTFKQGLKKAQSQNAPFSALGYILTTGANWAKPIQNFKLTIERDSNELVSFCWKGAVKKINSTQFQMLEKNFVPKQDLDVIFVHLRNE